MFKTKSILSFITLLFVLITPLTTAKIIYVDDDAMGANDGSSWENAYTYLQDALTVIKSTEVNEPIELRVAQGIYKPNQGLLPVKPGGIGRGGVPYPPTYPADEGTMATFNLINDVTLKGGFAGLIESDPNYRDVELYETILSGDLNGDDIEVNDPCDLRDESTLYENSINVLSSDENDANAVLDGFTITGGHERVWADPGPSGGAGMVIHKGNPTIINCTFTDNSTRRCGGGILILSSSPTLIDCTFTKNYADSGAGIYNGRIFGGPFGPPVPDEPGNPKLINCKFVNNYASFNGGGMYNYGGNTKLFNCIFSQNFTHGNGAGFSGGSDVVLENCIFTQNISGNGAGVSCGGTLTNCIFINNSAAVYGGGMRSGGDDIFLTNCIFSGNSAGYSGGGLLSEHNKLILINCNFDGNKVYGESPHVDTGGGCNISGDSTTMINCTFYGNWARQGCAIYKYSYSNLKLTNCILWGSGNGIYQTGVKPDITYSNIQGGWEGEGNIEVDPLFTNPGYWADANDPNIIAEPDDPNAIWIDGDYHLKSQVGRYDANSESWVMDDVTSPCIDAGDPNSPIGDEPEPNGGIINMGAYGGSSQASLSTYILFGQASNPNPPDGSFGISPDAIISWSAGKDAVSHDVYFGLGQPPQFVRNQTETDFYPGQSYSQGLLPSQAQCYWRIDEIDSQGNITPGDTWTFKVMEYKGRACFTGDTCVWIDGAAVPISKISAGQTINLLNNICKVEKVQEHEGVFTLHDIVLESDNCIIVAENHYFMTDSGRWFSLHDLKEGQRLKTSNGSVAIKSITKRPLPYAGKVYNLKIQGSDRYMVGEDAVIVRDY